MSGSLHSRAMVRSPIQQVGVGLRSPHYHYIEQHRPDVPWLEVLIDNFLGKGGPARFHLEKIRQHYPLTFHGVGLSLGATDGLNFDYLKQLKTLIDTFHPSWISDHLCWTSVGGHYAHDLLPLPYVEESIQIVSERIRRVQDYLGQRILVENVSSYLNYQASSMTEWDFLNAVTEAADCDILLDINNIHVSASNHGFDATEYLNAIPPHRVREMHLAGYEDEGSHLLDTHGCPVHAPVWALYRQAVSTLGAVPTLIEWDNNIPPFPALQAEARMAAQIMREVCSHAA